MFTGIVQTTGQIQRLTRHAFGVRLLIQPKSPLSLIPKDGDSVAVSGVCLTHAPGSDRATSDEPKDVLTFDVIAETLGKTTLGQLEAGHQVNLETAVTASTPMGGHFVQGHVDGTGQVTAVEKGDEEWRIRVMPPSSLVSYIVPKGSVCIDGVSLTIADIGRDEQNQLWLDVALIPTTLEITTLDQLKPGDAVNLEADMIAKTIVNWLEGWLASRTGPTESQSIVAAVGGQVGGSGADQALLAALKAGGFMTNQS